MILHCTLMACAPQRVAPEACDQPPTDKVMYFLGQYLNQDYALSRDSVVCVNFGADGYSFRSGWEISPGLPSTWSNSSGFRLEGVRLPGAQGGYVPEIFINFMFAPSDPAGPERPPELKMGRYGWSTAPWPEGRVVGIPLPVRSGVQVWLKRSFQPGVVRDNWYSYVAVQDPESYFEVTSVAPHPGDERKISVTGRFTVRLFGQSGRSGASILLRNVQFRIYFERPEVVYRKL